MKRLAWALTAAVLMAGCASKSEVDALRKEVDQLKVTQAALLKQVGGAARPAQASQKQLPASIDMKGVPFKGSSTARVALVEFSDYECPYCIRHFTQVMPEIQRTYIDTNRIRYLFRDFPIDELHPQAIRAHVASHCAAEQGKFWEIHDRLFAKAGSHTPEQLAERAREAGLDAGKFNACVANDKYSASIRQSTAFAISLGAAGTPFFLAGEFDPATEQFKPTTVIPGAFPFVQFQASLDQLLKK